jgi:acetylornithine deacetylase/succinyl-diaminopimelate desuccinylase-like protein
VIVLADSGNWDLGVPALTTSLRGLIDCLVEVQVLDHPVHSGMYGGVVMDALTALCRLLATLHDDDGTVAISGLASGSAAPLDLPRSACAAEAGILDGVRLIGTGVHLSTAVGQAGSDRLAIDTTRIADASNTLSCHGEGQGQRALAPGDDAEVGDGQARRAPHHACPLRRSRHGDPYLLRRAVQDRCQRTEVRRGAGGLPGGMGREPVDMGVGGTIPFVAEFAEAFPKRRSW